jgi:F0F1-type ATP synthase membrane subunit a
MYDFVNVLKHRPIVNYIACLILLEFLVAIIQSFVFARLVSVYIGLMCHQENHTHWEEL